MSVTDASIRELDWYLRDHFFRQSISGTNAFNREVLPSDMIRLYLRYRETDPRQLSETMNPVIENLLSRKVLESNGNDLKLSGNLDRFQCAKCFYINYLTASEPRLCMRCQHTELRDFPKKRT
ncbi:MAG: hypothetical protein MN733_34505 [Nitrososphaera sp.]|nr:hypothetical protein [Nitrososphaera sp.]